MLYHNFRMCFPAFVSSYKLPSAALCLLLNMWNPCSSERLAKWWRYKFEMWNVLHSFFMFITRLCLNPKQTGVSCGWWILSFQLSCTSSTLKCELMNIFQDIAFLSFDKIISCSKSLGIFWDVQKYPSIMICVTPTCYFCFSIFSLHSNVCSTGTLKIATKRNNKSLEEFRNERCACLPAFYITKILHSNNVFGTSSIFSDTTFKYVWITNGFQFLLLLPRLQPHSTITKSLKLSKYIICVLWPIASTHTL